MHQIMSFITVLALASCAQADFKTATNNRNSDGSSNTTGKNGGNSSGGLPGGGGSNLPPGADGNPGGPGSGNPSGSGPGPKSPNEILIEDGGTVSIVGVRTKGIRVNFEDTNGSRSKDLNNKDVYVCFSGDFKLNGRSFVTASNQNVKFKSAFQGNPCLHHQITIAAVDNTTNAAVGVPKTFDSRTTTAFEMALPINSRLTMSFSVSNPEKCSAPAAGTRTLDDDAQFVEVLNSSCI